MIEDLLIINESGALLFNWHPDGDIGDGRDDLLSGFLTALNSFATFERGEDIKSLRLKETTIIFEKYEKLHQKLIFVVTTKNDELIDLLHLFIHEVMDQFTELYQAYLNRDFDGEITHFSSFESNVNTITKSLGIDVLRRVVQNFDEAKSLKSVLFLDPQRGNIYFIKSKQYLNKEKINFLVPLLLNSARLLYEKNLNQEVKSIFISTINHETLIMELRAKISIIRQYQFDTEVIDEKYLQGIEKSIKKSDKKSQLFDSIELNMQIGQLFITNMEGEIRYNKLMKKTYDYSEYIPEIISFLTASRKTSEEIYNRSLFNCVIGGKRLTTICLNLKKYILILIGDSQDLVDFKQIQEISSSIIKSI